MKALTRNLTLCFFIAGANISFAQTDTSSSIIFWNRSHELVVNGQYKNVLSFDNARHYPENQFLPVFTQTFKGVYATEANLTDVVWTPLSAQELGLLPDKSHIPLQPLVKVHNPVERKIYNTSIEFVPLRKNISGVIEKMDKFKLILTSIHSPESLNDGKFQSQARLGDVSNSVLSDGTWYKLTFGATGIYKIDYQFLKSLGINLDNINPDNIQVWGNGGKMLPEAILEQRPVDLTETPVFLNDGKDGKFDRQDFILMYVQGPDFWKQENGMPYFRHINNIYSNESSYFIRIGNSAGKRIIVQSAISAEPDIVLTTTHARKHYERDVQNFLYSGRRWYGEVFDNNLSQKFSFPSTGVSNASPVYLAASFMNRDKGKNSFRLSLNSALIKTYDLDGGGKLDVYDDIGTDRDVLEVVSSSNFKNSNILTLGLDFVKTAITGIGYLNYLSINYEENLVKESTILDFRNFRSLVNGIVQFDLKTISSSATRIWEVSELDGISEYKGESVNNQISFKFFSDVQKLREFVAFSGNDFPGPYKGEKIENQNIRALDTPELLIITHPLFNVQANKLADFHRDKDNMSVNVVTTEEIYNEFSSGSQDLVAIRDYARLLYKRPDFDKFKYILLFGDCSYDYKNIKGIPFPQSLVPIYESDLSISPVHTYSSDDYIGLLDDNEGAWIGPDEMDIAVGRLPVKTEEEAEAVVRKTIHYVSNTATLGNWKQNVTFIADNKTGGVFLRNAEQLSISSPEIQSTYDIKRFYLSAFNLDLSGKLPDVRNAIAADFEEGVFLANYIGHGGVHQLADADVINTSTIQGMTNFDKLPFMVTATCDFGRYDKPDIVSGAEMLLLNPNGGAIGMLSSTRPVYQDKNEIINAAFYNTIFAKDQNSFLRIGEIIRRSKNKSMAGTNNRNFALLGDPAIKLSYPENRVIITKVNESPAPFLDTLKAFSKVTVSGQVTNSGNQVITDFNGVVTAKVFDKTSKIHTIVIAKEQPLDSFYIRQSKIFEGTATVKNGEFTFSFIVPRNINYEIGKGKISLYANMENGNMTDAAGGNSEILIGGGSTTVTIDKTPPQVKMYLNDESFVQGGITNENPLLIIKLSDENGISTVGDIGSSITAVLNNDDRNTYVLDRYYKSDRDTYKSGTIKYRFSNLNEGPNQIKLKAFDSNKNALDNGKVIEFNVIKHGNLAIKNLLNYPNPFSTHTTFHFDHNRAGDDLEIMCQIFTITGKLIKTLHHHAPSAGTHISELVWDGKDEFGDNIARGVYVYKLAIKALSDGFRKEEYQKLVILN